MLSMIFIAISALLFLNILLGKIFIFGGTNSNAISKCGVLIGVLFVMYSLTAASFVIFDNVMSHKIIMLFFALSPFIIGKLATYKTVNLFTDIQLVLVIFGIIIVNIIN